MSEERRRAAATACGKVILFGEHAVVYGVAALAAGVSRGARAEVVLAGSGRASVLRLGEREITAGTGVDDLTRAFEALLGADAPAVEITAMSELPPGGGLGSSAALGVAIARAIEALSTRSEAEQRERAFERAMAWERVFHGNPSGIDSYAAAHGGIFRFVRGEGAIPIVPAEDLWLCVGLSGQSASTRAMVEGVARLFERKPAVKQRTLEACASLVRNATLALEAGDLAGIGRLMDLNQMVLAGLFLSTEALEHLCALARQAGALGAKLTGSGGGGSVIALVPPPPPDTAADTPGPVAMAVLSAWKQAGFEGFATCIRRTAASG